MKVSREQVAENREAVLQAAAILFRERGFEGVTVAEIMRAAGLTHGAFYGHFKSKEELFAAAAAHELPRQAALPAGFAPYATSYLSPLHRDDPAHGCTFAALGPEAARGSPECRRALTAIVARRLDILSETAPGGTPAEKRQAAIAGWAAMVGAMILARLVDDEALSDEMLAATKAALTARAP